MTPERRQQNQQAGGALLLLLLGLGAAGGGYWYYRRKKAEEEEKDDEAKSTASPEGFPPNVRIITSLADYQAVQTSLKANPEKLGLVGIEYRSAAVVLDAVKEVAASYAPLLYIVVPTQLVPQLKAAGVNISELVEDCTPNDVAAVQGLAGFMGGPAVGTTIHCATASEFKAALQTVSSQVADEM